MADQDEPAVPALPDPSDRRKVAESREVVMAAVIGGGVALSMVILGLVTLGINDTADAQIASTGLASIGATLAGGFAGWIARGQAHRGDEPRRRDDPQ